MLTTLALLVTLAPSAKLTLFRATFVPIEPRAAITQIADARIDLQAVGATVEHGGDWYRETPIAVFGKSLIKPAKDGDDGPWLPAAILGRNRIVVSRNPGGGKAMEYREATVVSGKIQLGKKLSTVPNARAVVSNSSTEIDFPKIWWSYRHPNPKRFTPSSKLMVFWYKLPTASRVGSGTYIRRSPPDVNYYAEHFLPMVETSDGPLPLQRYVIGPKGLDLGQIAFVSRDGWLVVRAELGSQDGLAWLAPFRPKS